MSAAPTLVIGAGNVGCGVVAATLQAGRHPYVVVARREETVRDLEGGRVRVRGGTTGGEDVVLRPRAALTSDGPDLAEAVAAAGAIVVALGSGQARTLAPALAGALARRTGRVPVLVCDNRDGAAETLAALVAEHDLGSARRGVFAGVMIDRIVNHVRLPGGHTTFLVEGPGGIYVDRDALDGELPDLAGFVGVDRFRSHLTRKRYVFSAGHAAAAYLGGLRGYETLPDALADEEVLLVTRATMAEGQAGIAAACGEDFAGGAAEIDAALDRFRVAALADPVARVGRDPLRKLARHERICGPARLAQAAGCSTRALAVTAAAALCWGASLDPELLARRDRLGVRRLIAGLAGLGPHETFVDQAAASYRMLAGGGSPLAVAERLGGEAQLARVGERR